MDRIIKAYMTARDISERFSIPEGTLANWRWQKIGPKYYKMSRRVLYREDEVRAWVESNPVLTLDSIEDRNRS